MNLIVDIGNSTTKVAVFRDGEMLDHQRMATARVAAYVMQSALVGQCRRAIISTTAAMPAGLDDTISGRGLDIMHMDATTTRLPFEVAYSTPDTLGTDRIAAVAGALRRWPGENVLVIDAGSCVTYEELRADRHYVGGNIAPGLQMRLAAMHEHTARLPQVRAEGETPRMGHDTDTALRAGVLRGLQYEVEGYIHYINNNYKSSRVILTGGDSHMIGRLLTDIVDTDDHLVLRGLDYILQYNEKNA